LAHPAWPTGGWAALGLIAAVLVLAPAADAQSPCMPWEIYRPSLRMCEAMTDNSAQPPARPKVVVRERGSTRPSVEKPARPKVAVRERGSTRPTVEKPARPKVAVRERGSTRPSVEKPARPKVAVRERGSTRPSVEKPARPKVAVRERVKEVGREKEVDRARDPEPMRTIPLPEPKAQGSLNPLPRWKPDW
jgi:hypothetical protein